MNEESPTRERFREGREESALALAGRGISRAISGVSKALSGIANNLAPKGRTVGGGGREEYQERSRKRAELESLQSSAKNLEEINLTLKKIHKEVSEISHILKKWFELRNQISLKDLLMMITEAAGEALSALGRAASGVGGFLGNLLGNALGRRLGRGKKVPDLEGPPKTGRRGTRGGTLVVPTPSPKPAEGKAFPKEIKKIEPAPPGKSVFAPVPLAPKTPKPTPAPTPAPKTLPKPSTRGLIRGVGRGGLIRGVGRALTSGANKLLGPLGVALFAYDVAQNYQVARQETGEGLKGAAKAAVAATASSLTLNLVPPEITAKFVNEVDKALSGAASFIASKASEVAKSFATKIGEITRPLSESLGKAIGSVQKTISSSISAVSDFFGRIFEGFSNMTSQMVADPIGFFKGIGQRVAGFFSRLFSGPKQKEPANPRQNQNQSSQNKGQTQPSGWQNKQGTSTQGGNTPKPATPPSPAPAPKTPQPASPPKRSTPPPAPAGGSKRESDNIRFTQAAADQFHPGSAPRMGDAGMGSLQAIYSQVIKPSLGGKDFPITQLIGQNRPYRDARGNIVNPMGYGQHGHMGIDIATPEGTPVYAPFKGVAIDESGGMWGKSVVLMGKNIAIRYSHLSSIAVKSGTVVEQGQILGTTGKTGNARGAHLDITFYSVNNGKRGTWLSDYSSIARAVTAERGGKALTKEELEKMQREAIAQREALAKSGKLGQPGDTGIAPISSPLGFFIDNLAEMASSLPIFQQLGIDFNAIKQAFSDRLAKFQEYLFNLDKHRGMDIRKISKQMDAAIGKPGMFTTKPMVRTGAPEEEAAITEILKSGELSPVPSTIDPTTPLSETAKKMAPTSGTTTSKPSAPVKGAAKPSTSAKPSAPAKPQAQKKAPAKPASPSKPPAKPSSQSGPAATGQDKGQEAKGQEAASGENLSPLMAATKNPTPENILAQRKRAEAEGYGPEYLAVLDKMYRNSLRRRDLEQQAAPVREQAKASPTGEARGYIPPKVPPEGVRSDTSGGAVPVEEDKGATVEPKVATPTKVPPSYEMRVPKVENKINMEPPKVLQNPPDAARSRTSREAFSQNMINELLLINTLIRW